MCSAGACNPPSTSGHSGAVEASEGYEPKAACNGCPQQGQSGDAQHPIGPGTSRRKGLQRRSLRSTPQQVCACAWAGPPAGPEVSCYKQCFPAKDGTRPDRGCSDRCI